MKGLLNRLRRRCGAPPPWRLADCGPCVAPRGHGDSKKDGSEWHADGNGFIWTDTEWRWMGPIVDLSDSLRDDPPGFQAVFKEESP